MESPPSKRQRVENGNESSPMSSQLKTLMYKDKLRIRSAFAKGSDFTDQGVHVNGKPFSSVWMHNVFDTSFIYDVRADLDTLHYTHRSNDLFDFFQSDDLSGPLDNAPNVRRLRDYIYSDEFVDLMSTITNINLLRHPDLSAHKYPPGGHLLCHDDDIKTEKTGRRVAFIIYLVDEDWNASNGGCLDLYDIDDKGMPKTIKHSIVPKWNTMAFFELSPTSYHQVSEVKTAKTRYSISGWFHGSLSERLAERDFYRPVDTEFDLPSAINEDYLSPTGIARVKDAFSEESSVQLHKFLQQDLYNKMNMPVESSAIGPANLRQYKQSPIEKSEAAVISSQAFKSLLQDLTGLQLIDYSTMYKREYERGHYTLLHDEAQEHVPSLDVMIGLTDTTWDESWGGGMHYVAGSENLLTIWPESNCISLVYRSKDDNVMRFVKYVNHRAEATRREVVFSYRVEEDQDQAD